MQVWLYHGHVVHSVYIICGLTLILNDMSIKSIINSKRVITSKQALCLLKDAVDQVAIVAPDTTCVVTAIKNTASIAPDRHRVC